MKNSNRHSNRIEQDFAAILWLHLLKGISILVLVAVASWLCGQG